MNQLATRQDVRAVSDRVRTLETQVDRLRNRALASENLLTGLWQGRAFRRTVSTLPALVLATPLDMQVAWRQPMPDAGYSIEPDWPLPLGLQFDIKAKTQAGILVTLTASIAIALGTTVTVTAWS